jgi:serine/threonine protein kinase
MVVVAGNVLPDPTHPPTQKSKDCTARNIQRWMIQIGYALEFLHLKEIAHNDVKLANIMISRDGKAYLTDFGFAQSAGDMDIDSTQGTAGYAAPEVWQGVSHDYSADVWSFGACLYHLQYGTLFVTPQDVQHFWNAKTLPRIMRHIPFPQDSVLDAETIPLMKALMTLDPSARPTMSQMLEVDYFDWKDKEDAAYWFPQLLASRVLKKKGIWSKVKEFVTF